MRRRQNIKVFTDEQKKIFMKTLSDSRSGWRDHFYFNLLFNTGLRLSEALSLDVRHVYNGDGAKKTMEIIGKGGKIAVIPINKHLREHIERYIKRKKRNKESIDADAPLFISRNRKRITSRAMQLNFKKWLRMSGIEDNLSVHSCRHYVGTSLLRKTSNLRQVQEFLRHSDISTTQIYTHVSKDELVSCAEILSA